MNLKLLIDYDLTVHQYKSADFNLESKGYHVITNETDDAKFLVAIKK